MKGIIPPTNKTGQYICFININAIIDILLYSNKGGKQSKRSQCSRSNGKTFTGCSCSITNSIQYICFFPNFFW